MGGPVSTGIYGGPERGFLWGTCFNRNFPLIYMGDLFQRGFMGGLVSTGIYMGGPVSQEFFYGGLYLLHTDAHSNVCLLCSAQC